jgi:putative acetyltransferase
LPDRDSIRLIDPGSRECRKLIAALDLLQSKLYPPESNHLDSIDELQQSNCWMYGAFINDQLVGCGAIKIADSSYGEIKRLYVLPEHQGAGIGQHLLMALERSAFEAGVGIIRLETGVRQSEAISLYQQSGYIEIPPFGRYAEDPLSVFMEKSVGD